MANGDTLLLLTPWDIAPTTVPGSDLNGIEHYSTNHSCYVYGPADDTEASARSVMPRHYGGGDIDVTIFWSCGITSNNVVWAIAFERLNSGTSVTSDTSATAQTVTSATPGTSSYITSATITFTNAQADSVVAGDAVRILLYRNGSNGSDNMASDARLQRVHLEESS